MSNQRVLIGLEEAHVARLEVLKQSCGAPSIAGLHIWAMACYETMWKYKSQGGRVLVEDEHGQQKELPLTPTAYSDKKD